MHRLFLLLFILSSFSTESAARWKCVLKIELNDHSPLTVAIDNRDYKKVGTSLTFNDLPPGRHYLRVYEYKEYRDGTGGNAKLVYTGSVRIKKNTYTHCVVNPSTAEMMVTTHEMVMDNRPVSTPNNPSNKEISGTLSGKEIDALANEIQSKVTDTDKMKLLQLRLANKTYTTTQVRIMLPWFHFEESRLELAKWAYANTVDKNNYRNISSDFDYETSVKELESFLSSNGRAR